MVITTKPVSSVPQGDFVFGYGQINHSTVFGEYQPPNTLFQIHFDLVIDQISIEFSRGNLDFYSGRLWAYDSNDNLLAVVTTSLTSRHGTVWASINRPQLDIAYIQASSDFGTVVSVNAFQYDVVPVLAAVWLFGTALIGFVRMSTRTKAA
jgi:hypothetical protein